MRTFKMDKITFINAETGILHIRPDTTMSQLKDAMDADGLKTEEKEHLIKILLTDHFYGENPMRAEAMRAVDPNSFKEVTEIIKQPTIYKRK